VGVTIDLVRSLAWPATVLCIIFLFRGDLHLLLRRLSELSYRGMKLKFTEQLDQAEDDAAQTRLTPKPAAPPPWEGTAPYSKIQQDLDRIAAVSSRAAVVESWRYVELAVAAAAERLDMNHRGRATGSSVVRGLVEHKLFKESAIELYERLRQMRNEALQMQESALSPVEARRYVDLAISLVADIEDVLR
jgi:hypothetical protein